jgi:outer membrane protein OmpA-like peptidoglycan-associated protein
MRDTRKNFVLVLLAALTLGGCAREEEPLRPETPAEAPSASTAPAQPSPTPGAAPETTSGNDVAGVPVASPPPGKFPYVGLIDGYEASESDFAKDVPFDRYELFDGTKIVPVEGRLTTIVAEGKGASAEEILRTYETLVTGMGGVKLYEGSDVRHVKATPRLAYADKRHRNGFTADRLGVYMLRTPESEIWFEAYFSPHLKKGDQYFLTVVERQPLAMRASLLPAEEMKRELDAKGHVALYINFDFNRADIRPDSQPIVDEVVKLLEDNPGLSLTVEGHTDNVGAPDYNKRLSDDRARSVVTALTAKGIEAGRLKTAGFGQEKPIADNGTEEGRAKNRRVELVKAG